MDPNNKSQVNDIMMAKIMQELGTTWRIFVRSSHLRAVQLKIWFSDALSGRILFTSWKTYKDKNQLKTISIHESLHRSDSTFWEGLSLPFFEVTRDPAKSQATEPPRSGWKLPDEDVFVGFCFLWSRTCFDTTCWGEFWHWSVEVIWFVILVCFWRWAV